MTNLQQLEKRIREIVPSVRGYSVPRETIGGQRTSEYFEGDKIQLHHVLQAIPNNRIECRLSTPFLLIVSYETAKSVQWNLTLPLSGQSEDTINFLLELIK